MLTKILAFLLLLTLALLGFLSLYTKHTTSELKQANIQLSLSKNEINDLKKSITVQSKLADATEEAVTTAVVKTAEITQKTSDINKKIDKTTKEVKDGKIDPKFAAAAYVDSMWIAYCEANKSSTSANCTSK